MKNKTVIDNAQTDKAVGAGTLTMIRKTVDTALTRMNITYPCEVSVRLMSSDEIKALNLEFRQTDEPTDVLSFPSGDYEDGVVPVLKKNSCFFLGDIALCPTVAARNASEMKKTLRSELLLLTAHSVLHLLGYDHYDEKDKDEMFALQDEIVKLTLGN